MTEHRFGSDAWTEKKLDALRQYLQQWRLIFDKNKKAQYYKTIYIDAFAGTGSRHEGAKNGSLSDQGGLFGEEQLPDLDDYRRGSARIALELPSKFDEYYFIDKNPEHTRELEQMILRDFPELASRCKIETGDGCEIVRQLCVHSKDWRRCRAVLFLDPYGMNVEWDLLERIAATKAIDLWLLWPLGVGVNRLMTKDRKPNKAWSDKLTKVLGSSDWETACYAKPATMDLFPEVPASETKETDFKALEELFKTSLKRVFSGVAARGMALRNSCGNPMYLLIFASANPVGAPTAVRIADYLLKD